MLRQGALKKEHYLCQLNRIAAAAPDSFNRDYSGKTDDRNR